MIKKKNTIVNRTFLLYNYLFWTIVVLLTVTITFTILFRSEGQTFLKDLCYILENIVEASVATLLTTVSVLILERILTFKSLNFKNLSITLLFAIICTIIWAETWEITSNIISQLIIGEDIWDFERFGNLSYRIYNNIWKSFMFLFWFSLFLAYKILKTLNDFKTRQVKLEANLRESQINTLKGQINPHFMFNSLNNIRGLMIENVPLARDMITRLSENLRYSLTKSNENSIALEEELQIVDNYIEISKIQLEDRLQYIKKVDPNTLKIQIPPMILQMLVENAIKHSISELKDGGNIILETLIKDKNLELKVTNTGSIKSNQGGTNIGLNNIKNRLKLLYNENASFSLYQEKNNVIALIKIKL